MTAKGLSAELTDEGSVELKNEEGTEIFTIPAPYMTDADGLHLRRRDMFLLRQMTDTY